MNNILKSDLSRYPSGGMPSFQKWYRKCQNTNNFILKRIYKVFLKISKERHLVELSSEAQIGEGLYIGHPNCITINPHAVIGRNVNLHKGVTIGQENRGARKGAPVIGDEVWIGVNATIVGKITIGDDVLIAPNSYVNCDIPSHSIVFGNPCIVKHRKRATEEYKQ